MATSLEELALQVGEAAEERDRLCLEYYAAERASSDAKHAFLLAAGRWNTRYLALEAARLKAEAAQEKDGGE